MFLDLQDLNSSSIETDLCIVGAGPAGITIALALAAKKLTVCVLESGGFRLDHQTQSLCEGESIGLPYWRPLDEVRYRYFGGSTSSWGAWFGPLNPIDFEFRPWVPYSGWPLQYSDLAAYYRRAQVLCDVPEYNYDPVGVGFSPHSMLHVPQDRLVHRVWHLGAPTRFGALYRRPLDHAENVKVILHANVTKLETDDRGEVVTCARASTLAGHRIEVRAKAFVLASGGLEVPRLMLLSRTRDGIGIGNRYDLVGRFFMEHPHVNIGRVVLTGDRGWVRAYQLQRLGQRVVRLHLCLPECLQRKAALLNCSCSIDIPDEDETSYAALRRIKRTIVDPFENGSILRDLARTVANPLDVAFGVYSKLSRSRYIPRKRIPDEILLRIRAEQAPIPHSRVTLSDRRDALGLQQIKLDWQLSGEERRSMRIMARVLSEEFTRLGLGEVHLFSWLAPDQNSWPADLVGGPHHMGTTRMCDDPRQGVVDRDCRVHGVKNLFIAGSAVFPTGGYVNPTLTIVALAVRLADHLERVLPLPSLHVGPVGMARGKGRQMGDETTTP